MSEKAEDISNPLAPVSPERLADTGTTESVAATPLRIGAMARLHVGAVAVRVAYGAAVAVTDPAIGPYDFIEWRVAADSRLPRIEAADGVTAYEAWVWQSSPGVV